METLTSDRRVKLAVVFSTLFVISVTAAFAFFSLQSKSTNTIISPLSSSPIPTLSPEDLQDLDSLNIVLLGYGGAGHQGGFLTDVIILTHFDFKQQKIAFISIPRDLWVTVNTDSGPISRKINAIYSLQAEPAEYPKQDLKTSESQAGVVLLKQAIKDVTGLTPHFVIGVDFSSFANAIDALDGVEVNVPATFDDNFYPVKGLELELCGHTPEEVTRLSNTYSGFELEKQFPCRYEQLHFDKGNSQMDGATALKFVRSRHSGTHGGDFARSERQQALLAGIRNKLISLEAFDNGYEFFNQINQSIYTDIDESVIEFIAPAIKSIINANIVNLGLNESNVLNSSKSSGGQFILIPKDGQGQWSNAQTYIQQQLGQSN